MIELATCKDTGIWNNFLKEEKGHQLITIAHNPCLGPILEKTFGYKSENKFIKKGSKVVGVLPVVKVGKKLVSMPHFSYGGPIMDLKEQIELDLKTALENKKFEVRSFKKLSEHVYDKKITAVIELKSSVEEQLKDLKAGIRRKVRGAEKLNFKAAQGGKKLLNDFYSVYAKKMLQKGSPPLGKVFFRNLLDDYEFGEAKISALYDGEKVVAAGFTLSYLGFNELCWVSSASDYDKFNVNTLLYWNIIKYSIVKKHGYFSMGRSTIHGSNHHYKSRWKPMELPIYYNYSEPVGTSIKELTFLTKIWKLQPLKTSIYFGQIISKYVY